MTNRATHYRADGTMGLIRPANGETFTLDEMQKLVSGTIERIALPKGRVMILDEEGKLKDKPRNAEATRLASLAFEDYVVGDVLVGDAAVFGMQPEEPFTVKQFEKLVQDYGGNVIVVGNDEPTLPQRDDSRYQVVKAEALAALNKISQTLPQFMFTHDYLVTTDRDEAMQEALGVLLSIWTRYDGLAIMRIARAGLEDANFHTEAGIIKGWIENNPPAPEPTVERYYCERAERAERKLEEADKRIADLEAKLRYAGQTFIEEAFQAVDLDHLSDFGSWVHTTDAWEHQRERGVKILEFLGDDVQSFNAELRERYADDLGDEDEPLEYAVGDKVQAVFQMALLCNDFEPVTIQPGDTGEVIAIVGSEDQPYQVRWDKAPCVNDNAADEIEPVERDS